MMRILLVDDDNGVHHNIVQYLDATNPGEFEFVHATTIGDAQTLFEQNRHNLDLILMDACVPGHEPNTMALVRWMRRQNYLGPMICISSLESYGKRLIDAGCDSFSSKRSLKGLQVAILEALTTPV